MEEAFEGREGLLLELIRALLSLTGREVQVVMDVPGDRRVLEFQGVLAPPFRQPLDSRVVTIGFAIDARRLDLHLDHIADLQRWPVDPTAQDATTGVRMLFEDGARLELRARPHTDQRP